MAVPRIINFYAPRNESAGLHGPAGTPGYQHLKSELHRKLLGCVDLEVLLTLPEDRMHHEIRSALGRLLDAEPVPLNSGERRHLVEEVLHEVFGLGPLEPLLQDPSISDILVSNPQLVYVERSGRLFPTAVKFKDDNHLLRIIERIVSRVGRRIDESCPMVDARLPDGSRVNAVIPPIAIDGPALSIRRFAKDPLSGDDLVRNLTWTHGMRQFVEAAVAARMNIVVSGGTGAGKTTLLNVLSSFIPESERIVSIEDAAELQLRQTHIVRMETRPANMEGSGAVRIRDLVINALRMRPDRIIVGEVRGEEALDMMQAMNTGHDGSLTTIHANSPRDALSRLEVMLGMANATPSVQSIRQQISSAIDLFVHVGRFSDGSRHVTHISECVGMERDTVTMQDIFVFERTGISPHGRVLGRFRANGIRPTCSEAICTAGFDLPASLFQTSLEVQ